VPATLPEAAPLGPDKLPAKALTLFALHLFSFSLLLTLLVTGVTLVTVKILN
jgi:hypothetical protein